LTWSVQLPNTGPVAAFTKWWEKTKPGVGPVLGVFTLSGYALVLGLLGLASSSDGPGKSFGIPNDTLTGIGLLGLLLIVPLWGIIDAALQPDDAWRRIGQGKVLWIVLQLLLSSVMSIVYFLAIRPKLVAGTSVREIGKP
jgi:hypothetical protein